MGVLLAAEEDSSKYVHSKGRERGEKPVCCYLWNGKYIYDKKGEDTDSLIAWLTVYLSRCLAVENSREVLHNKHERQSQENSAMT